RPKKGTRLPCRSPLASQGGIGKELSTYIFSLSCAPWRLIAVGAAKEMHFPQLAAGASSSQALPASGQEGHFRVVLLALTMATDSSNPPALPAATNAFAAQKAEQSEENARKTIESLSSAELSQASCCVSSRLGRSFAGRTEYEVEKELDSAIAEAQRALPQ